MSERREIPFGRPWLTDADRAEVERVLCGHVLTHGPEGVAFEQAFARLHGEDVHAVTLSSCMAALHLAYVDLGLGPGDEVLVPALTHVAAVHAIEWVKARPVFVDCDPRTGNLTAEAIEAALTPRTRAVSLVHFAGIPCDMDPILAVAAARGVRVVEDCAIALGARYRGRPVGTFGDVGCFSFYPVKHITTGEGGMLTTRDAETARRIGRLRAFGVDRTHSERAVPGVYEVPSLGLNYRMSEMQAALGRSQLARLDENLERRRRNFADIRRDEATKGVSVLEAPSPACESSHYCLVAVLEGLAPGARDQVVRKVNEAGVGTSVYYPQPVPRMRYYRDKYGYDPSRFPAATALSDRSIALPVGPHLGPGDAEYVGRVFRTVVEEVTT